MKLITALNNKLNGCSFEQEGNDFYIVGADSVRKKLGSGGLPCVFIATDVYNEDILGCVDENGNMNKCAYCTNTNKAYTLDILGWFDYHRNLNYTSQITTKRDLYYTYNETDSFTNGEKKLIPAGITIPINSSVKSLVYMFTLE